MSGERPIDSTTRRSLSSPLDKSCIRPCVEYQTLRLTPKMVFSVTYKAKKDSISAVPGPRTPKEATVSVLFLGKTLHFHSSSLHPGIQ